VRAGLVGGVVLAAVLAGGAAVGTVAAVRSGEALRGTSVDGVAVGGLGRTDVRERVAERARQRSTGTLAVTAGDVSATLPRDLVEVDVEATVDRAMADDGPLGLPLGRGDAVPLAVTVDRPRLEERLAALAEQVDRPASNGALVVQGLDVTVRPPSDGRTLEQDASADRVAQALETGERDRVTLPVAAVEPVATAQQMEAVAAQARRALGGAYVLGEPDDALRLEPRELAPLLRARMVDGAPALRVDETGLRAVLAPKAEALEISPRRARFAVRSTAPVVTTQGDLTWTPKPAAVEVRPGRTGRSVDLDAAVRRLTSLVLAGEHTTPAPLPAAPVEPSLSTAEAERAGVRMLIGTFTTAFQPGQPRATNIRRIAEIVDGTYVPPGEVFSLNEAAGQRTRARGFVADGAIVDGELTDEVGGGVSQFATTLFNAAFFAGLPILEHKPHSFYISRYPAGRESTVYYGAIDVKFRNDTDHGLVVKTSSTPSTVTVELYGDNGGRRVTSTAGPRVPRADGGFRTTVTRTITGGDGRGERRVFTTTYDPVPPE
jgi:vancomycin resistance protein YoaR